MPSVVLYKGKGFQFVRREDIPRDFLPDWEYEQYSFLTDALIKDSEARKLFLGFYLKETPPLLLTDPRVPFNEKMPLPNTGFFDGGTIILFRTDDSSERLRLRELAYQLIQKGFLERDRLSIIRCNNEECGEFSIGAGDPSAPKRTYFCTKCGKPTQTKASNKRVTAVYTFSPELRDLLFRWRGRILEGMVYRQCQNDPGIKVRFEVFPYLQLQTIATDTNGREVLVGSHERDIVLVDRKKVIPPIVILTSISANQSGEKEQVATCVRLNLPTIFICARGMSEYSEIVSKSTKVFDWVATDPNFPASLTEFIIEELMPQLGD